MRRSTTIALATGLCALAAGTTFLLSPGRTSGRVQASGGCDLRDLRGDYGLSITGDVLAGGALPAGPAGFVGTISGDGHGAVSGGGYLKVAGPSSAANPLFTSYTGTYQINPDCTGTTTLNFSVGATAVNRIVLDKRGKHLRLLIADFQFPTGVPQPIVANGDGARQDD